MSDAHQTAKRRKLPNDRHGVVHEFVLSGHRITLSTGEYEDGTLGEFFVQVDLEGSTMNGVLDSFATACSMALQYGTPLAVLIEKFKDSRFPPIGFTANKQIPFASSIVDYLFRWLELHYAPTKSEAVNE